MQSFPKLGSWDDYNFNLFLWANKKPQSLSLGIKINVTKHKKQSGQTTNAIDIETRAGMMDEFNRYTKRADPMDKEKWEPVARKSN